MKCVFDSPAEIDLDVDDLLPFQVDKLNVIALDYGVQPGAYSKLMDEICPPISSAIGLNSVLPSIHKAYRPNKPSVQNPL